MATLIDQEFFIPIFPEITFSENHNFSAQVPNIAISSGAIINDHVIPQPKELSLSYYITNTPLLNASLPDNFVTNIISQADKSAKAAAYLLLLYEAVEKRRQFSVLTQHRLYTNMVITDVKGDNSAPNSGALSGSVKLQQVNISNVQVVSGQFTPKDKLPSGATQVKGASNIAKGSVSSPSVIDSITNKITSTAKSIYSAASSKANAFADTFL